MKFYSRILFLIIIVLLLNNCGEKTDKLTISFTDEVVADSIMLENPNGKAIVKITYQKIAPNVSVKYSEMNQKIDDFATSVMINYSSDSSAQSDINYLIDQFLISYEEFHDEFSEAPQQWEISSNGKISVYSNYVSQRFESYYNTGGAHPNFVTSFLNLNMLTGKEVGLLDLIKEDKIGELSSLCEKIFRENKKLSPRESLTEAGYWFDEDKFFLSDNFGFTSTSLIFYYNAYDIAPYVMGSTEIEVNFSEIPTLLKIIF